MEQKELQDRIHEIVLSSPKPLGVPEIQAVLRTEQVDVPHDQVVAAVRSLEEIGYLIKAPIYFAVG